MSSNTWIALLRGINLGRNKRVAMSDLRFLLESLGYGDVRTHLQSGNALFTHAGGKAADLEPEIEKAIDAKLRLDVKVIVRSSKEFASIFEGNPFVARKIDPKQLGATFLSANASAKKLATVNRRELLPEEIEVGDRVLYLRQPRGIQASKMPNWGKVLGVTVTHRNWNTVTRLNDLAK